VVLPTGVIYNPDLATPVDLFDDDLFQSLFGDQSLSHVQRVGLLLSYQEVNRWTTRIIRRIMQESKAKEDP
jgi:hypothetical protein